MNYKQISGTFDKKQFNNVAEHPLQSWEWGEARDRTGVDPVRIGEYDDDKLSNVFTMTVHQIPYTPYHIGYIPRSAMPSKEILGYLKSYGKEHNLIFIKFEPYVQKEEAIVKDLPSDLQSSPHPLFPKWTQILDLTPSEDDLMKNMKSKTRYNVRYAKRKEVVVKEQSNEEGFQIFSDLYFKTTDRQEYHGHTPAYHKHIWGALKENIAHILIAYYKDTPLAAYELFHFKDRFYYPYGGSSTKHRKRMGSNLLMWEAIRLGKKLKATKFDMWGSLPPDYDKSKPWAGFTRFKEGYGTEFVEFVGSYDLVINPLLYPLYNTAYSLRQKML